MIKNDGQVVLFITRKTAVVYVPDKHIKGKMSKSLTWKAGSFIDIRYVR